MPDAIPPDGPSDKIIALRTDGFHARRSKFQFAFESTDNQHPYSDIQLNGLGKKVAVFNYSSEYFRRKKSGNGGLNSIAGGNIPSDMYTEATFGSPNANPDGSTPKPIVCALNRGTGSRIKSFNTLNLSPNDIQPYPCQCGINPEWTANSCDSKLKDITYFLKYGGRCVKFNPPLPGTTEPVMVGITKAGSADCPVDTSWTFEAGRRHKPNFMYLPVHQCSCSEHPRAAGFANEDNYDCLKKNLLNSGGVNPNDRSEGYQETQAPCCDTFGNCMIKNLKHFKVDQAEYFDAGKGATIKYGPLQFVPICHDVYGYGASDFMGFSCNTDLNPPASRTSGFPLTAEMLQMECKSIKVDNVWVSTRKCDFGWLKQFYGSDEGAGCPPKPELAQVKAALGDLAGDYDDLLQYVHLYGSWFTRTYQAGGNTDCACTAKGWVTYSGSTDCRHCQYQILLPALPITQPPPPGGIAPPPIVPPGGGFIYKSMYTQKCLDPKVTSPKAICSCIWNDEFAIKGFGVMDKMYVTTLTNPSYRFSNGTKLEIGDNGEVRDVGCGQEVILNCNDIS